MNHGDSLARVPLQRSMGCLIASIQIDLSDSVIARLADDLLGELHRASAEGVIFDLAGVSIMDEAEFSALRRIEKMVFLMGAKTVYCGFKPGVVSALMDLEADVLDVAASRNLDEAIALVARSAEVAEPDVTEPVTAEDDVEAEADGE